MPTCVSLLSPSHLSISLSTYLSRLPVKIIEHLFNKTSPYLSARLCSPLFSLSFCLFSLSLSLSYIYIYIYIYIYPSLALSLSRSLSLSLSLSVSLSLSLSLSLSAIRNNDRCSAIMTKEVREKLVEMYKVGKQVIDFSSPFRPLRGNNGERLSNRLESGELG